MAAQTRYLTLIERFLRKEITWEELPKDLQEGLRKANEDTTSTDMTEEEVEAMILEGFRQNPEQARSTLAQWYGELITKAADEHWDKKGENPDDHLSDHNRTPYL